MTPRDHLLSALDPARFAESLGIVPDSWQRDALRSSASRQLWLCARQVGKSTTAAILSLHTALYQPGSLVLMVSPSLRQSSELYRKVQGFIGQLPNRPDFQEDTKTSATFSNGSRIVSLPSSEATVRGYSGPALIVEDEAAWVDDDLHTAIRPMLIVSGGRLILMSSPFGKRGHLHDLWTNGGDDWRRTKITAYDCPRIDRRDLEAERRTMPPLRFASEYECQFVENVDSVFRHEDIHRALSSEVTPLFGGS